jgi:hypothetical protein
METDPRSRPTILDEMIDSKLGDVSIWPDGSRAGRFTSSFLKSVAVASSGSRRV